MSQSESFPSMGGDSASPNTANSGSKSAKTIAGSAARCGLTLTRVDPWSVMKVSFMLSVAAGIMFVVAALFVWYMLDALHVFSTIKELAGTIMNSDNNAYSTLVEYLALKQTVSMAIIIGVVNVVLTTALATVTAFLYNLTATLVGGVHLTLADD